MVRSYILGIDTSSGWTSFGLANAEGGVASTTLQAKESRARGLVGAIRSFLEECVASLDELSGMGVVVGPGSFKALRVGVASAQGLAMGRGVPLVGVETHEAVASSLSPVASPALVVVPARKGEVFAQGFSHESGIGWCSEGVIECLKLEELPNVLERPALLAGPALLSYGAEMAAVFEDRVPLAPQESWPIRGESVALIARERLKEKRTDFDPGKTAIRYLQSHGALTIEEREKAKTKTR